MAPLIISFMGHYKEIHSIVVWTCARAFDCLLSPLLFLLLFPKNVLNFLGFFSSTENWLYISGPFLYLKSFLSPEIFLSFKREKDKQNIRPSVNDDFTQIKCGPRANSRSMKHDIYLDCCVCVFVCPGPVIWYRYYLYNTATIDELALFLNGDFSPRC